MNIVDRAQQFVHRLQSLARPSRWHGKTCPHCGSTVTVRNGTYARHPQTLRGRVTLRIQRHLCRDCGRSYAEQPPTWCPTVGTDGACTGWGSTSGAMAG